MGTSPCTTVYVKGFALYTGSSSQWMLVPSMCISHACNNEKVALFQRGGVEGNGAISVVLVMLLCLRGLLWAQLEAVGSTLASLVSTGSYWGPRHGTVLHCWEVKGGLGSAEICLALTCPVNRLCLQNMEAGQKIEFPEQKLC